MSSTTAAGAKRENECCRRSSSCAASPRRVSRTAICRRVRSADRTSAATAAIRAAHSIRTASAGVEDDAQTTGPVRERDDAGRPEDLRGREVGADVAEARLDGRGLVADGLAREWHEPPLTRVEARRAERREDLLDVVGGQPLGREERARLVLAVGTS